MATDPAKVVYKITYPNGKERRLAPMDVRIEGTLMSPEFRKVPPSSYRTRRVTRMASGPEP